MIESAKLLENPQENKMKLDELPDRTLNKKLLNEEPSIIKFIVD